MVIDLSEHSDVFWVHGFYVWKRIGDFGIALGTELTLLVQH